MTPRAWRAGQAALLLLTPLIPAAPGLLGFNQQTPLGLVAGFIADHPSLRGLLVIPVDAARDAGLALLAIHIVLLGAAGLACARMLRTFDLPRAALSGGVLYELAAASTGPLDWPALGALIVCPAFLDMLERSLRGQRRPVLRLGIAIAFTASLGPAMSPPIFLFGALWVLVRLRVPAHARPRDAVPRLLGAIVLGTVLASPLLLPRLALDELWPDLLGRAAVWITGPGPRPAPIGIACLLLPAVGLALLAAFGRTGRPLRLLLVAGLAAAVLCLAPADARPLALSCLAALFAIRLQDRSPAPPVTLAGVFLGGAALVLAGARDDLAFANLAALGAALLVSRSGLIPLLSVSCTAIFVIG